MTSLSAVMLMSLAAILNKVEDITKRPDARSRALISINSIIQDISNNADYPDDLVEVYLPNPTPGSYVASLSLVLPDDPPRRKIEYIVVEGGKPLTNIKPRDVLTNSGCVHKDAYYRVGETLQVNSTVPFEKVKMGYYKQVGWLLETDTHWLEAQAETLLIMGVCASVFRATGDDTSGQEYEAQYRLARQQFRRMLVDTENL